MMTRSDFRLLADTLKECHEAFNEGPKEVHEALDRAIRGVAVVCRQSNPNFRSPTFYSAAGYGTGNRCDNCLDPKRGIHAIDCPLHPSYQR